MGELSGGRSATWPTFFRSTSVRTRMLLQNSQTVCTLLDQRKTILAPQFGHLATGWVIANGSSGLRPETLHHQLRTCLVFHSYARRNLRTDARLASNSWTKTLTYYHSTHGHQQH